MLYLKTKKDKKKKEKKSRGKEEEFHSDDIYTAQ